MLEKSGADDDNDGDDEDDHHDDDRNEGGSKNIDYLVASSLKTTKVVR